MTALTQEQLNKAAHYMTRDGGFASAISDAYFKADSRNRERLVAAFYDLFERAYNKWDSVSH